MLLRGVVPQDLIGFLPLVKAKPKLRNWGLLLVLVLRSPNVLDLVVVLVLGAPSEAWLFSLNERN
jgi:hypothetical protein